MVDKQITRFTLKDILLCNYLTIGSCMIRINIQVKLDGSTYTHNEFVEDNYIASRQNPQFLELVKSICDKSGFEVFDKVKATVYFAEL